MTTLMILLSIIPVSICLVFVGMLALQGSWILCLVFLVMAWFMAHLKFTTKRL